MYFSADGGDYVCSGSVVTSSGENLVVTAGHCVYDASGFSTNFLFRPGFRTGTSPYGEWTSSELFTTSGWISGNFSYDVGMALMDSNAGATIQDTVGARGITFNQNPSEYTYEAFGYPAGAPFPGNRMYRCTSEIGFRDGAGAVAPMAIGCDMTPGSSEGGWVIDEAYVNSVVSYGYANVPEVLYGPYFGDAIENLYEEVAGDGPAPSPSPTPTSTPGEPVEHAVSLTLTMKRHLRATGRMSIPDGYLPCRRGAPVEIYRMIDADTGRYVGGATRDDGRFGVKVNDRPGTVLRLGATRSGERSQRLSRGRFIHLEAPAQVAAGKDWHGTCALCPKYVVVRMQFPGLVVHHLLNKRMRPRKGVRGRGAGIWPS